MTGMIGARVLQPVWLEIAGSFGEVQNFFEKNASRVYNFPDQIRFKYEAKLVGVLSKRWHLTMDYQYIGKKAGILYFKETDFGEPEQLIDEIKFKDYHDHFIIASILWKI
jgi:hypothetical protein